MKPATAPPPNLRIQRLRFLNRKSYKKLKWARAIVSHLHNRWEFTTRDVWKLGASRTETIKAIRWLEKLGWLQYTPGRPGKCGHCRWLLPKRKCPRVTKVLKGTQWEKHLAYELKPRYPYHRDFMILYRHLLLKYSSDNAAATQLSCIVAHYLNQFKFTVSQAHTTYAVLKVALESGYIRTSRQLLRYCYLITAQLKGWRIRTPDYPMLSYYLKTRHVFTPPIKITRRRRIRCKEYAIKVPYSPLVEFYQKMFTPEVERPQPHESTPVSRISPPAGVFLSRPG